MILFSIVIPSYNRAETILNTIESVMQQTYSHWEIILVDDGSTDETKTIITALNHPKIFYHFQENGERGKARNTGIQKANGEYVFFLDSDDLLLPNHLENAEKNIRELDQPEFFHSRYFIQLGAERRKTFLLNENTITDETIRQNPFACQFFLRKDIALTFPFSENRELKIGEDWAVILKIAVRYPLHFSNQYTAIQVQHKGRSMEVSSANTVINSRNLLIDYLSNDELITDRIISSVSVELTSLAALHAAIHSEKKRAISLYREAFKRKPSFILSRRSFAIIKKIIIG